MKSPVILYIDEAGDPGVREGEQYAEARHEWFCLAGILIRAENEHEAVTWIKEMRLAANSRQSDALHYARITRRRRSAVCEILAGKKGVRGFCIASHKTNVRSHQSIKLGRFDHGDKFYNWCLRLLLERVAGWYANWCSDEGIEDQAIKIVFARRGGHNYWRTFKYIDRLRAQTIAHQLHLKGRPIPESFLRRDEWAVESAQDVAGLQLADVIASAFYQGANTAAPSWDPEPAMRLRPIIAKDERRGGKHFNIGITVLPFPHQGELPAGAESLFRFYGMKR